jgi:hypothetical protein
MAKPKKLTVRIIRELREDYARNMNKIGTIKMARQLTNYDLKTALALVNWVLERPEPSYNDATLVALWCNDHRAPVTECPVCLGEDNKAAGAGAGGGSTAVISKKTLQDCELAYICAQCRQEIDGEPIMVRGEGLCGACSEKTYLGTIPPKPVVTKGDHICGFCGFELTLENCREHMEMEFKKMYGDDDMERL